jgi:hypothetical protein
MAFNASSKSGEFHYLVEFLLDATTLRYAEEDLSIQINNASGAFYQGKLPESGTISRSLGSFLEAKETLETFQVVVDNRDEEIQNLIQTNTFSNRNVNVWLGEGVSKANYSLVFPGYVAHPNGIGWDEDAAKFTIIDRRLKDRKNLPLEKYTTDLFPNLERNASGSAIPIIYGNFSSNADGGVSVPAICTDMTQTNKPFKVAGHRVSAIDRVMKNGLVVNFINTSLDDASFELNGIAYNATTDIVSANCQGIANANGTLIELPHRVLENMHTAYMGATATDLNATAFNTLDSDITEKCRSVINTITSTETLTGELRNEASIDMRFVGGKYSPKFRSLDLDSDRSNFFDVDIVLADVERDKAEFSVEHDPNRVYANKITGKFNFDPVYSVYLGAFTKQLTSATQDVSAVVDRPMTFNWLYKKSETEARIERELVTFGNEPLDVSVTFTNRGMLQNLADQIDLTYNVFNDRTFQIRSIETDLSSMVTRIQATDVFLLGVGRWALDTSVGWASASQVDKDSFGFWSYESGYIVTGDNTSFNKSLWF